MSALNEIKRHGAELVYSNGQLKVVGLDKLSKASAQTVLALAKANKETLLAEIASDLKGQPQAGPKRKRCEPWLEKNPYYSPAQLAELAKLYPHLTLCPKSRPPWFWVYADNCASCKCR